MTRYSPALLPRMCCSSTTRRDCIRPCRIWFKYRDSKFYDCTTHAFACTLSSIPTALVDTAVYSMIVYFMNGFYYSAGTCLCLCMGACVLVMWCKIALRCRVSMWGGPQSPCRQWFLALPTLQAQIHKVHSFATHAVAHLQSARKGNVLTVNGQQEQTICLLAVHARALRHGTLN